MPQQAFWGFENHLYLLPPSPSSSLEKEPIEKRLLVLGRSGEILREKLKRRFTRGRPFAEEVLHKGARRINIKHFPQLFRFLSTNYYILGEGEENNK
jgi:hypothetical protein